MHWEIDKNHLDSPQWITTSRLLRLGEAIEFDFFAPNGIGPGQLVIFERYLEQYEDTSVIAVDGDLSWLDGNSSEELPLIFSDNRASMVYRPAEPGNYLARWDIGSEVLYRYFAVIEDDWVVLRFSTGVELDPSPNWHATGIPLDYRLPVVRFGKERMSYPGESGQFAPDDPVFQVLKEYHWRYGDAVIPHLPDTPEMDVDSRVKYYGDLLERVKILMPDPNAIRSARVSMRNDLDPGYTQTFARLYVHDHCGLEEANCPPWLGMPEFPYFSSLVDCRKVNQGSRNSVVAHQWDFCGGWHFLGPTIWHHEMAEGRWELTENCLRQGIIEAENMADLSGHPAFLFPLYDGVFQRGEAEFDWAERLQKLIAFRLTKETSLAFARSIDIADYYRRHFENTPTTVFVSQTDHLDYDRHWLVGWHSHAVGVTQDKIPWDVGASDLRVASRSGLVAHLEDQGGETAPDLCKDPLSTEYILIEDQHRQVRFERESPIPVWYFDYTDQISGPVGSEIAHTVIPVARIDYPEWVKGEYGLSTEVSITSDAPFSDYAIAVWGLPGDYDPITWTISTSAKRHILARNTLGENHLVLFFDLERNQTLDIHLLE